VAAIRECARQDSRPKADGQTTRLQVRIEAPDHLPALPAAVEVAAYRITQEALMNVVRHAGARTCTVRLSLADVLTIEILDDGIGLPREHRAGVGLESLHERAAELGGSCLVEALPDGGTRVVAWLPVATL
jgi:signal transduction histidine kinase